jgi:serine/threonine-protein kinase
VGPGTDIGSYVVEARLGAGGYATVFRAQRGGRLYALKLIPLLEVGASAIREVLALSRVIHTHVVRLLGFWQWPDARPQYLVVVMEYVEGLQLGEQTRAENPSTLGVLRWMLGMARALEAVHAAGLLHLDVKEANIIIRQSDGEAVLVDFGLSASEHSARASWSVLPPGTPHYSSPEAWRFARERRARGLSRYRPTVADDLYALGRVLYWMLTDRMPFYPDDAEGVDKVLHGVLVPPHEHNPRVPLEVSALCQRLLDRSPEARPRASAVCEAVEGLLTQRGEAWEQPLCDGFNEHTITTRPGPEADEVAAWLKDQEGGPNKPRRGPRPARAVEQDEEPGCKPCLPQRPRPRLPRPRLHQSAGKPSAASRARAGVRARWRCWGSWQPWASPPGTWPQWTLSLHRPPETFAQVGRGAAYLADWLESGG